MLERLARAYEHHFLLYRRTWRGSLFSSFLSPVMFLLAMGVGLGTYVNRTGAGGGALSSLGGLPPGITYLAFLAPGLMAATAMQTASFESMFPVMGGFVWQRRYHAMFASPIQPAEIALSQLAWGATRLFIVTTIFFAVTVIFGAVTSPLAVLAIPAAVLTGLAFAAPITAYAATRKVMTSFNYIFRFGITPLFLFSGTFFPVEALPPVLQPLAWLTPLYHGVALCRSLALGTVGAAPGLALIHLAVLLGFIAVGVAACLITFRRRLAT
jgi:lipooligosaccharide transport system permease protein